MVQSPMPVKKQRDKVYAFIDSQNLNLGVRSQGWRLDFARFRVYLADKYKVEKAFLFIGFLPKNRELYSSLTKAGYVLIYKPVVEPKGRAKAKGNVDAELVLHAMIEFPHYKKAVIVSGDGDFHCLVEYLEKRRKLARIIVPNRKYSSLLRKFRKEIVHIGDFRGKVQKNERD
ncbi:MAG TPA: NYN domain-containing protein [Patescibacteria group bacterium]|nr:NYN domain-containing protein [Patescibacteria group bacterium]